MPGRFVGGKTTTTTQDHRDAWFIELVERQVPSGGTVIEVRKRSDDGRPTKGLTGSALATRLLRGWRGGPEARGRLYVSKCELVLWSAC